MKITSTNLRQIIREELQREFMSSRKLKLADFGGDLPPVEPPEPEPERGGGPSGIKAWYVSPMEMRHEKGVGTETGGLHRERCTLDQFLRKWSVSPKDAHFIRRRVEEVLAKIAASAFDDLEDDEDDEDDYDYDYEEDDEWGGWNPHGEEPALPPRDSYALVVLDFTAGPPPRANVVRYDGGI
jgi:hypothetical protein